MNFSFKISKVDCIEILLMLTFQALRKITLGSLVHSFSTDWRKSGLIFHDISSRMAYGLQTLKVSE